MVTQIKLLERDTEFKYEGITYKLGNRTWNSSICKEYLGPKANNETLEQCIPKIGGKFQKKLGVFFNHNTEVDIKYD